LPPLDDSDFLDALEKEALEEEEDDDACDLFQLFSFASSSSICSWLHSLLQNAVSPLKKREKPKTISQSVSDPINKEGKRKVLGNQIQRPTRIRRTDRLTCT